MDEWKQRKMEYGKRKLIKMRQKKEEEGLVMNEREELLKSSKEEPLYQSDKHWQSGQRMLGGHDWSMKQQMEQQSFIKVDNPSSFSNQPDEEESLRKEFNEDEHDEEESLGEEFSEDEYEEEESWGDELEDEKPLVEWLQPSEGEKWPEHKREVRSWVRRKLEEALDSNKDDPSSLMKEREEWLKEQEHKIRSEALGKDWPNISHVPSIRVN